MRFFLEKSKQLILFLCFFIILNLFLFITFETTTQLTIEGKAQNTSINFFYDNKNTGGYPFDESHLTSDFLLTAGKVQTITVPISYDDINKLRIDFGTDPSSFDIYSLSISKSPFYKINISGQEFIDKFSNVNDVSEISLMDGVVKIHTSGTDGHIYSTELLKNTKPIIRIETVKLELLFLVFSLALAFINKVWSLITLLINILHKIYKDSKVIITSRQTNLQKTLGFSLVFIYSIIFAFFVDLVLFRCIAKVAQIGGFDTLFRYFSASLSFSVDRIYFIFIFFFTAGLIAYMGKRKAIRYRYLLALIFLVLMILGRFTGSSLGFYDGMLQSNTPSYEKSTILGIPQGVRGDEWATEKPYYFAQVMNNNNLPYFNDKLSFDGSDMVVSAFAPVKDIVILARPDLWGFLFLSPEYAFSFYWMSRIVLLFMASFEMGLLLTKRYRYAILSAIVITFAPPVQWWLSQALMIMLMSGQYALVLFNKYLNSKSTLGKYLSILGVGFFAMVYILTMYPATQVPLAYVFLAILIYLCVENNKRKPFAPIRIIQYILAIIPFAAIILHFFIQSKPALDTIMNTVYPGSNRPWISLPWDYELYQFVNAFTASIQHPNFLNSSEISQFYTFMPFILLLTIALIKRYNRNLLLPTLLLCASLFLWLIAWMPKIPLLNKITMLDFTYPVRITYAYGFGMTLLIISLLPLLEVKLKDVYSKKFAGLFAGTIYFLTLCVLTNSENAFDYFKSFKIGTIIMILFVGLLSYMGYLLLRGGSKRTRQFAILLVFISVGSTLMVNPITRGTDSMFEKATMAKIREIDSKDSGRWMVSGSPTISNLVTAQGVARTTGTYYYPDWSMMKIIDKDLQFVDLWNQFAHIDMRLTDEKLEFSIFDHEVNQKVDGTNRIIYIPIETARELKIKYIFTMYPIPQSIIDNGDVTLLYSDEIDPWSIYMVNYDTK